MPFDVSRPLLEDDPRAGAHTYDRSLWETFEDELEAREPLVSPNNARSNLSTKEKVTLVLAQKKKSLVALVIFTLGALLTGLVVDANLVFRGWYAMWCVGVVLILLIGNVFGGPEFEFLFGILMLVVGGVISIDEAVSGFGDPIVFSLALLYVISKGIRESTAMNYFVRFVLGHPSTLRQALTRLVPFVMCLSAFTNNTAIVAVLVPVVKEWASRQRIPSSKLLMPLSFSAILGGMCTTIGTSVNLIVVALNNDYTRQKYQVHITNSSVNREADMDFFEIGLVGVPVCVVGAVYMIFLAQYLLPDDSDETIVDEDKEPSATAHYSTRMRLIEAPGKSAHEAGFDSLHPKLVLTGIHRCGAPVSMNSMLQAEDEFEFSGALSAITTVLYRNQAFRPVEMSSIAQIKSSFRKRRLIVAVVSLNSRLVGRSVRSVRFRQAFDAAIVGIRKPHGRSDSARGAKMSELRFGAGDALLLEASENFVKQHQGDADFISVCSVSGDPTSILPRSRPYHALAAAGIMTFIIVSSASKLLHLTTACLIGMFGMLLTRTISRREAAEALNGQTLIVVGSGFALSRALTSSGASRFMAHLVGRTFGSSSFGWLLTGLFLVTSLLSNIISPSASVTIMFPIAYDIQSAHESFHEEPVLGILMIAGSCSVLTSFSYQTNMMVAASGSYSAKDFIKFGGPLLLLIMATAVPLATFVVWGDVMGRVD